MRIAVLMKYVPSDIKKGTDEKGGILRTADNGTPNLADVYALETAVALRSICGGSIGLFTMGPRFAEALLRGASALGADELFLITDPAFAGSDSFVTALVLSRALAWAGAWDLILCGERTTDGETGQVPGELSAMMDVPFASGITAVSAPEDGRMACRRIRELGSDLVSVPLPVVLGISCGMSGVGHPLAPSLEGLRLADHAPIRFLDAAALGLTANETGAAGSPTKVIQTSNTVWLRTCRFAPDIREAVRLTLEKLHE